MHSKSSVSGVPLIRGAIVALIGLAVMAGLVIPCPTASAANMLSNGNFNAPLAGSWTTWTYGGGWANRQLDSDTFDGSDYMACGGSTPDNSGGGVYQIVNASPGYVYTLSVESGVQPWWWPTGEMRLFFLDQTGQGLETNRLIVTTAITNNNTGLGWSNYTLSALAPAGTAQIKVEFASQSGSGTVWFDNAVLTAPVATPDIAGLYPDGSVLLQPTNLLAFTATSGAAITNIQVILNGSDISSSLTISGSATSKNVSAGLKTNEAYSATITLQDANGFSKVQNFQFDTFSSAEFSWEAEDYDFNGGSFFDNPVISSVYGAPGNYFQQEGVSDVDYHDITVGTQTHDFRAFDLMATEVTADVPRQAYLDAQVSDPAAADYDIGYFDAGEWVNFTRTYPSGIFNVYARMSSPGSATLNLARVTGGWGTASQTTASLGNFMLEGGLGWGTYSWVPLRDSSGNLVKLTLGGTNTLRATTSGNCNLQFFLLTPAITNLPSISGLYPNGATQLQPTNMLAFTAQSTAGINDGSIQITLYVTNLYAQYSTNLTSTNGLVLSGPATSRSVQYSGLTSNTVYRAVVSVTDVNNNTVTSTVKFDTYKPVLTWEAEDWDYSDGQFKDNPAVDAYANLQGVEGVDYHDINASGGLPYRPYDAMSADIAGDVPRTQYLSPSTNDYALGYFVNGEWVNYTRTIPAGTYNIYGRFAAGGGTGYQTLSRVTNGVGTASQQTELLGTFNILPTGSWTSYAWTPLRDAFGNLVQVSLSGVTTLRLTRSGGSDANVNYLMLEPAATGLPTITSVFPPSLIPGFRQSTNRFAFTASSASGIATSNIIVTLGGVDVSAALSFSGSSASWNVSYPYLAPDVGYSAVITVKDNNGVTASTTVYFDTFSTANYTWEAEDWDYNGGQFVDNPQVNAYANLAGVLNVDYYDTTNGGAQVYRDPSNTDATEAANDYLRPEYDNTGHTDYDLANTATGEWENYTRTYPAGTWNVYIRAARGTAGTAQMPLSRVTSGRGTSTQTLAPLGTFNIADTGGWQVYLWKPLLDASGNLAVVTLGGVDTLRLSDGGANVNFFALVPALVLKASVSGAMHLSFGTQPGFDYTIQYKNTFQDATWTPLVTVAGDGTIKTVNDPLGSTRFYRLQVH
jgi:Carbohydrate binding module (family 6)